MFKYQQKNPDQVTDEYYGLEEYRPFVSLKGFPKVISLKESNVTFEILMEALGMNLKKILKQSPTKQLSEYTIYNLTLQILDQLERLHIIGFIHNDIKPDNIVVGYKDPENVYLIDFGLACRYHDSDGSHNRKIFL